jgi:thiol-disulfide isomerase/thioredoxin
VTVRSPRLLGVLAATVIAAGATSCTSSGGTAPFPNPSNPAHERLVARAHLDPCPESAPSSATAGGLPDLTLPCLGAGPAVHLAGLRGVPTVVNVWGSWCGPCQEETKFLSSVYDALKPRVRFLGVDTEETTPDSALDFATHVHPPMRYPSVLDNDKKLLIALRIPSTVPVTLFIDAEGRIRHTTLTPYRSSGSLRADVSRYLGVNG